MSYATIEEYNSYLVENQVNINIIDYDKEVNRSLRDLAGLRP